MKKFVFTTTIPLSLKFFAGQYAILSESFEVIAVSSEKPKLETFCKEQGIKPHYIPMEREISLLKDFVGLLRFIFFFLKVRPFIVHGNTPKASLLSMTAAWITRVPHRIYMCHGLRYQGCSGLKRKILIMMERVSCFCATNVLCVSDGVKEALAHDKICYGKTAVILNGSANGIDINHFNPENVDTSLIFKDYNLKKEDFILCFVGRIVKDKGIEELTDAFTELRKKYENLRLLLIGSREEGLNRISKHTEDLISENDSIVETGNQNDIRPFVKSSKILILPSYREGFGLVLMEAGALGVPVIATDILGCNNVVQPEVNGLLCVPHSSASLLVTIETLYNNHDLYNKIKSKTRNSIIKRFNQETVQQAYFKYYKSL